MSLKEESKLYVEQLDDSSISTDEYLKKEIEEDKEHDISYRNCSWQKTAGLLLCEYICLATLSFPWSYSVLGLGLGLIVTVVVSLLCFYTGLIVADYCAAYPHLIDICDIGQHLVGPRWIWHLTAVSFLIFNLLIQALHVLVGEKYLNTISDNKTVCSVVFGVVSAVACFLFSLPRTFSHMSGVAYFASGTMLIAMILAMVFAGIQEHPFGYEESTPVVWTAWPKDQNYVNIMSAVLNIVFTFAGQLTYPSFISQMSRPRDFKKALTVVTIIELITYALVGAIIYVYVGNAYITAPAFGSLTGKYKKIAYSFAVPTIVFLGSLFSNISAHKDSVHRNSHTVTGWLVWIGLNGGLWILAFIVAEVIPFFSDLLSLMSSLFSCFFGFIFWALAYFKLKKFYHYKKTGEDISLLQLFRQGDWFFKSEFILNVIIFALGWYILGPGLYSTVQSIIWSYQKSLYGRPFSCASNAI
ncbi:N amino acid transport system protein [Candida viswanathii]|uniref:N amino acid transport system protein n=1 Tax=Candida viswanathii TaxID=5486 RepID=A0A367YIM9_9ASCO|nr:N amino acid transport system protein [Candida viswanathii]